MKLEAAGCVECAKPRDERSAHMHPDFTFRVPSSSNGPGSVDGWYTVLISCGCIGAQNGAVCKHIYGSIRLKEQIHKDAIRKGVETRKANKTAASVSVNSSTATPDGRRNPVKAPPDGDAEFWGSTPETPPAAAVRPGLAPRPSVKTPAVSEFDRDPDPPENHDMADPEPDDKFRLGDPEAEPVDPDYISLQTGDYVQIGGRGTVRQILEVYTRTIQTFPYNVPVARLNDGQRIALKLLTRADPPPGYMSVSVGRGAKSGGR